MGVYVVRKWPLRGRSRFVCWSISPVSVWLLCNVHFVQSIRPTIATWPRWPKGTDYLSSEEYRGTHVRACVRQELEYRVDVCRVTRGAHIEHCELKKKKTFSVFSVAVNNSIKLGPLVSLLIKVCNNGEHYKTPCTV